MSIPRLESYLDVRVPDTYWREVVRTGHGWEPAEHLRIPHHHATRLELANLAEVPLLAAGGPARARITIELTARDIRHDAGRSTWFVTYHARIVDAQPSP